MDFHLGQTNIQGFIYPILNIIALALIFTTSYRQGLKDGVNKRIWSVTLFLRYLFFIIGCKLFTISLLEFYTGTYSIETLVSQRTLAGGILFGLTIFTLLFFYFHLSLKVFDYAVVPTLAALSIQKIGCFVAGCCFGTISNGLLSVTYPKNSLAFFSQINHQYIHPNADLPLPVHPIQLYESFGYGLCAFILYRVRNKFPKPGSIFLLSSSLILSTRLITNFFRAPESYNLLGHSPENLGRMQITLALLLLLTLTLLYLNSRNSFKENIGSRARSSWVCLMGGFLILCLTIRWFNIYELAFLLYISFITIHHHWKALPRIEFLRISTLFGVTILLTAQQEPEVKKDSVMNRHNLVRVGFSTGSFMNSLTVEDSDGCSSQSRYFNQKQTMGTAGFGSNVTRTKETRKGKRYISTTETYYYTFFGSQSEQWADNQNQITNFRVFGGGAQIRIQDPWFGVGVGANVGNLRFTYQNKVKSASTLSIPEKGYWSTPILPSGYFRIGPRHILFAEYNFAQSSPIPSPSLFSTLMIGSGFGLKNGTSLRFGTLTGIDGALLALQFPVGKKWGFEGYYHFGETYNNSRQNQVAFSLEYKLPAKN